MVTNCPHCGKSYQHQLTDAWLIVCPNCHRQITSIELEDHHALTMPDDWSAIQIGTTGVIKGSVLW